MAQIEGDEGLKVLLHNDRPAEQILTVRIRGLEESENPQAQGLLSAEEIASKAPVAAGKTAEITIPWTNEEAEAAGDPVEAELVASGEGGGLARQPVTILFEDAGDGSDAGETTAEAKENVLRPGRGVDLTLDAINFLPSPLSHLTYFFIFLTLVSVLLLALVFRQLQRWRSWFPRLVQLVLFASVLGAVLAAVLWGFSEPPPWHPISPEKIGVADEIEGNVGTAASENGKITQLVVSDGELEPVGLEVSGSYSGKYDLTPDDEKGEAAATVNVRDFWPYAVLTLLLGLLFAFSFHRWYEITRPAAKARVRREELKEMYEGAVECYRQKRGSDPPLPGISLKDRFDRLEIEMEEELEEGNSKGARDKLDLMRSYLDQFNLLCEALLALQERGAKLKSLDLAALGREAEEFDAYQGALLRLGTVQSALASERSVKALEDKVAKIEEASDLLDGVWRELQMLQRDIACVDALLPLARRRQKQELGTIRGTLLKLSQDLVNADTAEAIATVEKDSDPVRASLIRIWKEIQAKAGSEAVPPASRPKERKKMALSTPVRAAFPPQAIEADRKSAIARAKTDISDKDRIVGALAFALAVASGMATLYFGNASWGEPGDYLAALAWGGITGEGVKLAANIADRKFPG
ncbi:MAG: hypothetical protein M3Y75_11035 [Actinomycetota bacterium]|nr:hypothetical protein [Actinomycetota bacterium]